MSTPISLDTCAIINLKHINKFNLVGSLAYYSFTTQFVRIEFDNGHDDSRTYFYSLVNSSKLTQFPLSIEDLISMANVPRSKRISDAELSCFVVSLRIGSKIMTDDQKAIRFAVNNLGFELTNVVRLTDILLEGFDKFFLGESDLRDIQQTLSQRRFIINIDLASEAARRRLMSSSSSG